MKTAPIKYRFAVAGFSMFLRIGWWLQDHKFTRWLAYPVLWSAMGFGFACLLFYTEKQLDEVMTICEETVYKDEIERHNQDRPFYVREQDQQSP